MGIGDPDNGHTLVSPALLEGGDRRWAGVKACTVSVRQDTDPKKKKKPGMVTHTFNPSTQEAEAG